MQNKALGYAVLVSLLVHGIMMFIHFVPPSSFHIAPPDPKLEVLLVNAKSKNPPLMPEAVAQANLDGGGNREKALAKSPLPDSGRTSDGDALALSQRRVKELEKEQKQLAAKVKEELKNKVPKTRKKPTTKEDTDKSIKKETEDWQALAGKAAAIERNMEAQGGQPKKVHITPRTREVGYAMYYKAMQRKIEKVGTLSFPQRNGKKLYGELMVRIPVYQDGTLYEKDGGIRVEKSSGNPALDSAALRIVRRAAPFGRFPPKMLSGENKEVWVILTRFKFTRDDALETESGG